MDNNNKQQSVFSGDKQKKSLPETAEDFASPEVSPAVFDDVYYNERYNQPCNDSVRLQVLSNGYIEFCDTIDGTKISALIKPDTAYSKEVGIITYFLTSQGLTDTISTTYNHIYSSFFNLSHKTYSLCKDNFYTDLNDPNDVPFKFLDINFDGINEFLVVHQGYNGRYYEVYMKNDSHRFVVCNYSPYDKLVSGSEASTYIDKFKKTIEITEHLGCCKSNFELYKLQSNKRLLCVSKQQIEMLGPDSIQYTIWKYIKGKLVQTAKYIE